ncbi:hypothetical protein [Clostridium formicaceticum]|uniref:Copper amine oxidase-like N-terminal domain-containing protein n=1 Tax=Clostridium formicaceticum TaxID=1497 RepID=A0AAC9WET9_9CLOT|nr:hypothetical protein [Clostridium formicaceticum]AOY75677.1 hypothetical protein BJL90_07075 [Clostridium formicaceticum]ARE85993.1 hypothetical protein CLFO_03090 [Clostridium formicaceticum]
MKKVLVVMLLVASMLTMVGFAPAEASYWEELKTMYEWDAMEGDVTLNLTVVVPPDLDQQYKVHMYSETNLKDFISYTEMHIEDVAGLQHIPTIKAYTQGSNLYINREAMLALLAAMGKEEALDIPEAYVMLQSNQNNMDMNANILKDMIAFIEEMDLGIDLGMTQEGNVYTLTLESDELIDLLDAYIQYVITNIDQLPAGFMPPEATLTEEEKQEVLQSYNTFLAPHKEMAKAFIQGSFYHQVSTFEDDAYNEKATLAIKTPMGQVDMESTSTSKRLTSSNIQLPTSVMTITEEELTHLLTGGLTQTSAETSNMELKAVIGLEGDYVKLAEEVEAGKLQLHLVNKRAHITMADASKLLDLEIAASEDLLAIKDLENYGFYVIWQDATNTIEIYQ